MNTAWFLIFLFDAQTKEFVTKIEERFNTMQSCLATKRAYDRLPRQSTLVIHKTLCVTDNHHSGRAQDKGVPGEIAFDTDTSFQIASVGDK